MASFENVFYEYTSPDIIESVHELQWFPGIG